MFIYYLLGITGCGTVVIRVVTVPRVMVKKNAPSWLEEGAFCGFLYFG